MSRMLNHCATRDINKKRKNMSKMFYTQIRPMPISPLKIKILFIFSLRGRIQTLTLKLMSRVLNHCATRGINKKRKNISKMFVFIHKTNAYCPSENKNLNYFLSPCVRGRIQTFNLKLMSWLLNHCATRSTMKKKKEKYLKCFYTQIYPENKNLIHFLSPCVRGRIRTLNSKAYESNVEPLCYKGHKQEKEKYI